MRDTGIILVEGMPGTGKSTVSQFISRQLHANGRASYWCHEERATHPVRLFYEPGRHLSSSDYSEEAESRWQSYAHELLGQDQIAVLDAAILQNHVRSMLLFDCDRNAILDLVRRIERLLTALDPVLIYLKPDDVEGIFRNSVKTRGQRLLDLWIQTHEQFPYARRAQAGGYAGFIAFWEELGEVSDRIYERLTVAKLQQNIPSDDSGARYGRILDFLDLPVPCGTSSSRTLERFTGEYVPLDDDAASGFILKAREECLVVLSDEPTMDVRQGPIGCFREVRFIPKGKNKPPAPGTPAPHTVKSNFLLCTAGCQAQS